MSYEEVINALIPHEPGSKNCFQYSLEEHELEPHVEKKWTCAS